MRRASFALSVVFVFAWAAAVASAQRGNAEAAKVKNPVASSAESIAAGKAAFGKNCRFCHGADAKGNGPMAPKDSHPSDLTDAKWDRGSSDGEIFAVIRDGDGGGEKAVMKGYNGKLTDTDMWNIVNYLRSIGTK